MADIHQLFGLRSAPLITVRPWWNAPGYFEIRVERSSSDPVEGWVVLSREAANAQALELAKKTPGAVVELYEP